MTEVYLNVIAYLKPSYRVAAAMEFGIDPRLARKNSSSWLLGKEDIPTEWGDILQIRKKVDRQRMEVLDNSLARFKERNSGDVYTGHKLLLPFATISYPVEAEFMATLGIDALEVMNALAEGGGTSTNDSLALTEHPFFAQQLLGRLEAVGGAQKEKDLVAARHPGTRNAPRNTVGTGLRVVLRLVRSAAR